MNRDTLDVALVAVNAKRARLRRQVAAGFRSTDTTRAELERLDAAHADLAAELDVLKAAQFAGEIGAAMADPVPDELLARAATAVATIRDERPVVDPTYPAGGRVPLVDTQEEDGTDHLAQIQADTAAELERQADR